jgi:tRNA(Ile)-lysidine synthase
MAPAAGIFVRPLLDRSRAEVLAYLADRRLDWREDPTNLDPAFTRNWFRHNVIPMLEGRMPGARTSLAALAAAGRADERALEGRVAALTSALVLEETPGRLSLAGTFPAALSPAHRGRAVRHIYRRLVGSTRALERRHVEAVLALGPGGAAALPANVLARREADGWTFERRTPAPQLRAWEVTLNVPGKTALLPAAAEVAAELAAAPAELRGLGLDEVWLAARFAGGGLVARSWRDGDCMRPVGLGGRKKLQDIFVDGHVPAAARRRWPVVCEGEDIIWVPGLALAEGASAAPGGDSLRLRCVRTAGPARERNPYGLQRERR